MGSRGSAHEARGEGRGAAAVEVGCSAVAAEAVSAALASRGELRADVARVRVMLEKRGTAAAAEALRTYRRLAQWGCGRDARLAGIAVGAGVPDARLFDPAVAALVRAARAEGPADAAVQTVRLAWQGVSGFVMTWRDGVRCCAVEAAGDANPKQLVLCGSAAGTALEQHSLAHSLPQSGVVLAVGDEDGGRPVAAAAALPPGGAEVTAGLPQRAAEWAESERMRRGSELAAKMSQLGGAAAPRQAGHKVGEVLTGDRWDFSGDYSETSGWRMTFALRLQRSGSPRSGSWIAPLSGRIRYRVTAAPEGSVGPGAWGEEILEGEFDPLTRRWLGRGTAIAEKGEGRAFLLPGKYCLQVCAKGTSLVSLGSQHGLPLLRGLHRDAGGRRQSGEDDVWAEGDWAAVAAAPPLRPLPPALPHELHTLPPANPAPPSGLCIEFSCSEHPAFAELFPIYEAACRRLRPPFETMSAVYTSQLAQHWVQCTGEPDVELYSRREWAQHVNGVGLINLAMGEAELRDDGAGLRAVLPSGDESGLGVGWGDMDLFVTTAGGWRAFNAVWDAKDVPAAPVRDMAAVLKRHFGDHVLDAARGFFLYPPRGFREWHTNRTNPPGWRAYVICCPENDRMSQFAIRDPESGRVHRLADWNGKVNMFRLGSHSKDYLVWHTIYSLTKRWSYGARLSDAAAEKIFRHVEAARGLAAGALGRPDGHCPEGPLPSAAAKGFEG